MSDTQNLTGTTSTSTPAQTSSCLAYCITSGTCDILCDSYPTPTTTSSYSPKPSEISAYQTCLWSSCMKPIYKSVGYNIDQMTSCLTSCQHQYVPEETGVLDSKYLPLNWGNVVGNDAQDLVGNGANFGSSFTNPQAPATNATNAGEGGLTPGAKIGLFIGIPIVVLIMLGGILVFYLRRRAKRRRRQDQHPSGEFELGTKTISKDGSAQSNVVVEKHQLPMYSPAEAAVVHNSKSEAAAKSSPVENYHMPKSRSEVTVAPSPPETPTVNNNVAENYLLPNSHTEATLARPFTSETESHGLERRTPAETSSSRPNYYYETAVVEMPRSANETAAAITKRN